MTKHEWSEPDLALNDEGMTQARNDELMLMLVLAIGQRTKSSGGRAKSEGQRAKSKERSTGLQDDGTRRQSREHPPSHKASIFKSLGLDRRN